MLKTNWSVARKKIWNDFYLFSEKKTEKKILFDQYESVWSMFLFFSFFSTFLCNQSIFICHEIQPKENETKTEINELECKWQINKIEISKVAEGDGNMCEQKYWICLHLISNRNVYLFFCSANHLVLLIFFAEISIFSLSMLFFRFSFFCSRTLNLNWLRLRLRWWQNVLRKENHSLNKLKKKTKSFVLKRSRAVHSMLSSTKLVSQKLFRTFCRSFFWTIKKNTNSVLCSASFVLLETKFISLICQSIDFYSFVGFIFELLGTTNLYRT